MTKERAMDLAHDALVTLSELYYDAFINSRIRVQLKNETSITKEELIELGVDEYIDELMSIL